MVHITLARNILIQSVYLLHLRKRTFVILQDHLADCLLLVLVDSLRKDRQPLLIVCKCLFQLRSHLTDVLLAHLLYIGKYSCLHLLRCHDLFHLCKQLLRNRAALIAVLRLADLCYNLIDELDNLKIDCMTFINGINHHFFFYFICASLNHNDLFAGRCNGQLQITLIPLCLRRIYDQLTVHKTHLRHRTRTVKRDIGNAGGNRCAKHRGQLRTALRIYRHYHIV